MSIDINKLITSNADFFLENLYNLEPGHNGPYNDPETRVRLSSHLFLLFIKAHSVSEKDAYKKMADKCLEELLSDKARPFGYTFHLRNKKGKNRCDGLIGQAWVLEALTSAYDLIGSHNYRQLAEEVFLHHKQTKTGYWKRCEITGQILSVDKTFNHQLWFAAAGAMISTSKDDPIGKQINRFMDNLDKNISIHKNGLIRHLIWPKITTPIHLIKSRKTRKYLYNKEAGYHAFNLYALAILKERFPIHKFWSSKKFSKVLEYAISDEHLDLAEQNKYGFPYNPSGIELAYFIYIFRDKVKNYKKIMKESLERQFKNHLDKRTLLMNRNTNDPTNLAARIYEASRLPNLEFDL